MRGAQILQKIGFAPERGTDRSLAYQFDEKSQSKTDLTMALKRRDTTERKKLNIRQSERLSVCEIKEKIRRRRKSVFLFIIERLCR